MSIFYKGIPYWDRALSAFGQHSDEIAGLSRFMGSARDLSAIRPLPLPHGEVMLFDGNRKFSTMMPRLDDEGRISTIDLPNDEEMYNMGGEFILGTAGLLTTGDIAPSPVGGFNELGRVISHATGYDIGAAEADAGMISTMINGGSARDYLTSIGWQSIGTGPAGMPFENVVSRLGRGIIKANNLQFLTSFNHQHLGHMSTAVRDGMQVVNHPDEMIQPYYEHDDEWHNSEMGLEYLMQQAEAEGFKDVESYMSKHGIAEEDTVYLPPRIDDILIPMGHRNPFE